MKHLAARRQGRNPQAALTVSAIILITGHTLTPAGSGRHRSPGQDED